MRIPSRAALASCPPRTSPLQGLNPAAWRSARFARRRLGCGTAWNTEGSEADNPFADVVARPAGRRCQVDLTQAAPSRRSVRVLLPS